MRMLSALRVSVRALFTHRLRATLAVCSVAVGVVAVVVTGAISSAVNQDVLRQTENLGSNLLVVRPTQVSHSAARKELQGEVTSLTLSDYQATARLSRVSAAMPGFQSFSINVKAGNHAMVAGILGTTSGYMAACRLNLRQGRFLDEDDDLNAGPVAILGARVNETLFGHRNAIGQQIRVRDIPFEVIGVLSAKGVLADGADEDGQIVIPIRTAMERLFNYRWINTMFVSVRDVNQMDEVRMELAELLRDRHRLRERGKPDDFEIQDKTRVLARRKQLAKFLTDIATALAASSLFVGGIGILTLMLMSVKERTMEIGLRRAIGATSRDILIQFLLEATCIAAGGWLVGIALGTVATLVVAKTTTWNATISPELVLGTLAVVAISGLSFGTYPARKASLLLPIQALRVE